MIFYYFPGWTGYGGCGLWLGTCSQVSSPEILKEGMCNVLKQRLAAISVSPVNRNFRSSVLPGLPWTVCKQLHQLLWATQAERNKTNTAGNNKRLSLFQYITHPFFQYLWITDQRQYWHWSTGREWVKTFIFPVSDRTVLWLSRSVVPTHFIVFNCFITPQLSPGQNFST